MPANPTEIPYDAGWPQKLRHRRDPNRVTGSTPRDDLVVGHGPNGGHDAGGFPPRSRAGPSPGRNILPQSTRDDLVVPTHTPGPATAFPTLPPGAGTTEPGYYDISLLKAPLWKWEIAWYFFLGGMSAGSYVVSRMAGRGGGRTHADVARVGTYVSLLSFLPCPPLLIHDLGDPKRFHHMLRVFKPTSPMSLGTWAIMGYSGLSTAEVARQWLTDHPGWAPTWLRDKVLANRPLALLHDALGVPFALAVAGYTGILLSCSSNPLWSKNKWLGPLFSASALATGSAATGVALAATAKGGGSDASHHALEKIDTVAHVIEAVSLAGFLKEAGPKAATLTRGKRKGHLWFLIAALATGELLKLLPLHGKAKRRAGLIASLLSLAGGFALRWAMVQGGHDAANDPHTARLASRAKGASGNGTKRHRVGSSR